MEDGILVGRADELTKFERRLASARAGHGRLVLVEGEAGIGKTALADSLVRRAAGDGMRTAWGACLEGEGAPAYRPWLQILRELGESGSVLLDPVGGGIRSRFSVLDDVADVLCRAAAERGLMIVVDDLHWADVSSVRLLQVVVSLLADSRVLVVALYRGQEAFSQTEAVEALRAVARERSATTMTLGGLAPGEVAELSRRASGGRRDDALVRAVQARAEGNPLFVLELTRLVAASGRAASALPDSVREVIGRRLEGMPSQTRILLRRAAVLGREFTVDELGMMLEVESCALLDRLHPAVESALVRLDDVSRLRFAHVLTQEVLYAELPAGERPYLHARAAKALRSVSTARSVDALAYHLRQAAPVGDADEALRVTREAAERAFRQLAYEHAAFQYRAAIGLLPLTTADEALRAQLLLESARCDFRAGAVEDAWRSCRAAADLGRATGQYHVVADAATVLRGITNSPLTRQIHAMSREALALLGDSDPVREAKLLAQQVLTADPFASGGEPGLSQGALRIAEATGDPDARIFAMHARHTELVDGRHVLERLSLGDRALRLAREGRHEEHAAWGHAWRLDAFWELGRRVQFDAELAAFTEVVHHLREPLWSWRLTMIQACLALFEGRFESARTLADQALGIGRRGGHEGAEFTHLVFRAHAGRLDGVALDAAEAEVRRFCATGGMLTNSWLAYLLVGMGRHDEAAEVWAQVAGHMTSLPRSAPEWIVAMAGAAEVSVAVDDRVAAEAIYDHLLPYADHQIVVGSHTPCSGPASLYLGMLARLLGRGDASDAQLQAALASCTAMGSEPFEAMTHLELARLLRQRRAGQTAVLNHLEHARRIADRLGMAPLITAADALLEELRREGALSAREEQVAALVAEGLTNRQIAHRLHVSDRTAENHVARILLKLGVDSRVQIATWYTAQRPTRPE